MSDLKVNTVKTDTLTNLAGTQTLANPAEVNSIIETWYYDDGDTVHANNDILNQGFTRLTTNQFANKNGGMTHSTAAGSAGDGIWTFPSTGVYDIFLNMKYYNSTGASDNSGVILQITTNNSAYSDIDGAYGNDRGASAHNQIILHNVLNITDVSNQKIKFKCSTGNNITIQGSNDVFGTKIRFIKLCASV